MAGRTDDVVLEVGAGLAFWGCGVLAVLVFDGWPSYVLAGLAFCLGVYLMLAVWFDWPRPRSGGASDTAPPSPPSARVQVTNSPDWSWDDTTLPADDDRPFVTAKDSAGWKFKGTSFATGDSEEKARRRRHWWRRPSA